MLRPIPALFALAVALAGTPARAADPPLSAEFGVPYQMRLAENRTVLELTGSFSARLAPDFETVIAHEPALRTVRLESPGGQVWAAMKVAETIQRRGLNTYVSHFCASACTLAFLGGRQRWAAPGARLGFHEAHTESGSNEQANKALKAFYQQFGVPPGFIDHVLRTAPSQLWEPTQAELRAARITTTDPPSSVAALAAMPAPPRPAAPAASSADVKAVMLTAPNDALVEFATVFAAVVAHVQQANPSACWDFAHDGNAERLKVVASSDLDSIGRAMQQMMEAARYQQVPPLSPAQRQAAATALVADMRAGGQADVLRGLQPGADHEAFCPALGAMLRAALALPTPRRATTVRALLSGG